MAGEDQPPLDKTSTVEVELPIHDWIVVNALLALAAEQGWNKEAARIGDTVESQIAFAIELGAGR